MLVALPQRSMAGMGSFWGTVGRVGAAVATGGISEVARVVAKPAADVAKAVITAPTQFVSAVGSATGTVVTDVFKGATGVVGAAGGAGADLLSAIRPQAPPVSPYGLPGADGTVAGIPLPILLGGVAALGILIVALSHKRPPVGAPTIGQVVHA